MVVNLITQFARAATQLPKITQALPGKIRELSESLKKPKAELTGPFFESQRQEPEPEERVQPFRAKAEPKAKKLELDQRLKQQTTVDTAVNESIDEVLGEQEIKSPAIFESTVRQRVNRKLGISGIDETAGPSRFGKGRTAFTPTREIFEEKVSSRIVDAAIEGAVDWFGRGVEAIGGVIPKSPEEKAFNDKLAKLDWIDFVNIQTDPKVRKQKLGEFDTLFGDQPSLISQRMMDIYSQSRARSMSDVVIGATGTLGVGGKLLEKGLNTTNYVGKVAKQAEVQLLDRFAPLKNLVKGAGIPAKNDPYIGARLFQGHYGKIENRINAFGEVIKPAKQYFNATKEYAVLERMEELLGRGITKFPESVQGLKSKFPKNITPQFIAGRKKAIEQTLGGEGTQQMKGVIENMRNFQNNLLGELQQSGVLSKKSFQEILKNNEKYLPFQRMEFLADQLDNIPSGKNAFSVAGQNVVKAIKGSEKELADPMESIIRNIYKIVNTSERNVVARKVADLAKNPLFKESVVPIKEGQLVPKGMEKISALIAGTKRSFAVPFEVSEAMKGMNKYNSDLVTKWAGATSQLLKKGATTLNVAFIPANAFRDYYTATIASDVGFTPVDWVKGFAESFRKGKLYEDFLESGASFSGFFERNKSLAKTTKQLMEGRISKTVKTIINPAKLLATVGEKIELAPRIGVFARSQRLKKGVEETAFAARNATVDFARSGTVLQVVNQWIPFLNARIQGTANVFRALKSKPGASALKLGALVGTPLVSTYLWNTRNFPEVWKDIAQFEKDNSFILIYGDEKDDQGRWTQVAKIPKGDVGRIFGNPLESFLEYSDGKDSKSLDTLAIQTLSDISPISFEADGKISGRTILSSVTPPLAKAGIESTTNMNLFTGRQIVPQSLEGASPELQFTDRTSTVAKAVGQTLGMSPLKIDNAIGTTFGGLGRDLVKIFSGQLAAPLTTTGKRFAGAFGGELDRKQVDRLKQIEQDATDTRVREQQEVEAIFAVLKNSTKEEAVGMVRKLASEKPKLAEKLAKTMKDEAKGLTYADRTFNRLGVNNGARARAMLQEILNFSTKEEAQRFIQDKTKKGIMTDKVAIQLATLIKKAGKK